MLQEKRRRLAIFDVEGVLIPKNRYLLFEVGKKIGFSKFARMIFYGLLYELGLISLKSAMRNVFKVFKGFQVEEFLRIFRTIPLLPGVEEVFEKLKSEGWKTALISSGLPTVVVQDLASRLRADHAFGFELEMKGKAITGVISGEVIEHGGKLPVLMRILEAEDLAPKDCVVVVDDRNNAPMLLAKMLKIGYNADFIIRWKADKTVTGNLLKILSIMKGEYERRTPPSKNEIIREIIHVGGFIIPILSSLVGLYPIAVFIIAIIILYAMSELARIDGKSMPIISSITHHAATYEELYEFAAAPIFFALGILLALLLFPNPASSATIAIFALGDSTASIFGRIVGKKTIFFNKGKTLEGSVIGLFFAFLGATFYINPLKALAGAVVAMIVEILPLPLNDNLVIPLITGIFLTFVV